MDFSIMFFSSGESGASEADGAARGRYDIVLEAARFADASGFTRVWLPERHFVPFGALHPNPAVLAAALAGQTRSIRLAAGSVVMPLHDPLRVAEEWSVVDNLSGGRVDLSFASGWNPDDFALAPAGYPDRHALTRQGLAATRLLWRGERLSRTSGTGQPIQVRVFPTPLQAELPTWLTAARNPETFRLAGELGANVLTYLVDLGLDGLADCVRTYRKARADAGHDPDSGVVTVMLHTLLDDSEPRARRRAEPHYHRYLRANAGLLAGAAAAFGRQIAVDRLSPAELDTLVAHQFDRVFDHLSFMGSPESCTRLAHALDGIGVDEVACLLDFVADRDEVMATLSGLDRVREALGTPPTPQAARRPGTPTTAPPASLAAALSGLPLTLNERDFYRLLREQGADYGARFRAVERIWVGNCAAVARLRTPPGDRCDDASYAYGLHPATLDSCLLALLAIALAPAHAASGYALGLPRRMGELTITPTGAPCIWAHAVLDRSGPASTRAWRGDVRGLDEQGRVVIEARGVEFDRPRAVLALDHAGGRTYDRGWQRVPESASPTGPAPAQSWLLVADDVKLADGVRRHLTPGATTTVYPLSRLLEALPQAASTGAGVDPDAIRAAIVAWHGPDHPRVDGLACVLTDQRTGSPQTVQHQAEVAAAVAVGLARAAADIASPAAELRLVTRGAQVLPEDRNPPPPATAVLWGLGRTLDRECPALRVTLLDLDPAEPVRPDAVARLLRHDEPELAVRRGEQWRPNLSEVSDPAVAAFRPDPDRAYLVTGAGGGLGGRLATWLAAAGARHLILVARSPIDPDHPDHRAAEHLGARLYRCAADVADPISLRKALDVSRDAGCPPLSGVFHLAGVLADATYATVDGAALSAALLPKCAGLMALAEVTADTPLDVFVCFTSLAAVAGSPGQVAYAAANAFADSFMLAHRARGVTGVAIAWGPWTTGGMATGERIAGWLRAQGVTPLSDADGLRHLSALLTAGTRSPLVLGGNADWQTVRRLALRHCQASDHLATAGTGTAVAPTRIDPALPDLLQIPTEQQQAAVLAALAQLIARISGLPAAQIEPTTTLTELGLDSLMALELRNVLEARYGVAVPIRNLLLNEQTVGGVSEALLSGLLLAAASQPAGAERHGASVEVIEV